MANNIDVSTLTVSGTSLGLSSASPTLATVLVAGAKRARIVPQDGDIYWRDDGDAATSADEKVYQDEAILVGMSDGDWVQTYRQILDRIRFIRVSGDVKVVIHWYD